jgi:hypothetical protein
MNRILTAAAGGVLGAAGALAAAGLISAAPASADTGCVPDIVCDVIDEAQALPAGIAAQPGEFTSNLAGQPGRFASSIDPATVTNEFLNGNCTAYPDCTNLGPDDTVHPGLLNQPAEFSSNLAGQPAEFASNLAGQPGRFAASIQRSLGAFGADEGPTGDDGAGGTGD